MSSDASDLYPECVVTSVIAKKAKTVSREDEADVQGDNVVDVVVESSLSFNFLFFLFHPGNY